MENIKSILTYCFLITMICLVVSGCATYRPAKIGSKGDNEPFSLKGTGCESGRGIVNIGFCWLEIPHEVEARIRKNDSGHPFSIIPNTFSAALGIVGGTVCSVERVFGGTFEIILSPFPPYSPIMNPAYPPYLNFGKDSEQEECTSECEKK